MWDWCNRTSETNTRYNPPKFGKLVENTPTWAPASSGRYRAWAWSKEAKTQRNEAPLLCLKPLLFILGRKSNDLDIQGGHQYFFLDCSCSISLQNTCARKGPSGQHPSQELWLLPWSSSGLRETLFWYCSEKLFFLHVKILKSSHFSSDCWNWQKA